VHLVIVVGHWEIELLDTLSIAFRIKPQNATFCLILYNVHYIFKV